MRARAALLPALLAAAGAAAQPPTARTLLGTLSPRQTGQGEATLPGTDVLGAWANPALLAGRPAPFETELGTASMFGGLGSRFAAAAAGRVGADSAVAGIVSAYTASAAELDAAGDPTGRDMGHRVFSAAAVGARATGPARWGATVKVVTEGLAGARAVAVGVDLGAALVAGSASAGVAVRNLGPRAAGTLDGELPLEVRGGVGIEGVGARSVSIGAEVARPRGGRAAGGAGVEWRPHPAVAVRAGLGWEEGMGGMSARAGLTCAWGAGGLDYATRGHPLGMTHLMSLSWRAPSPARVSGVAARRTPIVLAARPLGVDGKARKWKIEVRDSRNRIVRTLVGRNGAPPPKSFEWDGLDDRGKPVLNMAGVRVRWEATDAAGRETFQDTPMPVVAAAPRLVSPAGLVELPEVAFTLPRATYREWRIEVRDGRAPVWVKEGTGMPGPSIAWSGRDREGHPVELAEPRYAWRLVDEAGGVSRGEGRIGVVTAPVERDKAGDWIRLPEIVFADSATGFSDAAREVLDGNAAMILRYPNRAVEVMSVAAAGDDPDLAEPVARERAETVLRYMLEEYGVRSRRIIVRCRAAAGQADRERIAFSIFTGD